MTTLAENDSKTCSRCGAPFGEHARLGFCSRCVASVSLAEAEPTSPSLEELASALPRTATGASVRPRFGDYELLEEIARGGMGVVYRARQRSLNRVVAVKMLLFARLAGADHLRRFRNEAAAAAALEHPNIVRVLDAGEQEGQPFIAMEYVAGTDLARAVQDLPWSASRACACVAKIARAISFAHQHHLLHRDLKPSNVLLDAFDEPRVTDFGLARNLGDDSDLTVTGQTVGSPNFMPPEQARGDLARIGPASDVYGLGAILYHLLTTRPPFLAPTVEATLSSVREHEPLPPRQLNPATPRDLETICLKCLEKEPANRYASAQELADDLDRFLRDEPIQARPVSRAERAWRWCRRKPALAASIFLVLVLLLVLGIGGPVTAYRINQTRKLAEAEAVRAETGALAARRAQYASDMNLAHQAVRDGDFFRARQLLERHSPVRTTSTSSLASPLDMQAGERLLRQSPVRLERGQPNPDTPFTERVRDAVGTGPYPPSAPISHSPTPSFQLPSAPSPADLRGWEWRYLWQQLQGEEKFILATHTNGATAVGVVPDGNTVFTAGRDKTVRLWNLETREQVGELPQDAPVMLAAASPDGRWLVTGTELRKRERQPLYLWDLPARRLAAVLATNFWLRPSIVFSPDGKLFAVSTVFDGIQFWETGSPRPFMTLPSFYPYLGPLGMAFSPDSRTFAYNAGANGDILLWDVTSQARIGRLTGHTAHVFSLAFSPDGRLLASGASDKLCVMWDFGMRQRKWAQDFPKGNGPKFLSFTPDGRSLFAGNSAQELRAIDVESGAVAGEFLGHLGENSGLSVAPYGKALLSSSRDGTVRVWELPHRPRTNDAVRLASISERWPTFGPSLCLSPDGRHLVTIFTNQTFSVWETENLRESPPCDLPLPDTSFACVANGGEVVAFGSNDGRVVLWNSQTGEQAELARLQVPKGEDVNRLAFSWDGARLAIDVGDSAIHVWDVAGKRELRALRCNTHPDDIGASIMSLAFSKDGRHLMAGNFNGRVWLWQLSDPPVHRVFLGHETQVRGLALLPGGETLVSAGEEIRLWDVRSQTELLQLSPRHTAFQDCTISPDGRRFAVAANDGMITIWDIASHHEVATLPGHVSSIRRLAFTPSGNELISVSKDLLRVWRAARIDESNSTPLSESNKGNTP